MNNKQKKSFNTIGEIAEYLIYSILLIGIIVYLLVVCSSCTANTYQIVDTVYDFNRAILVLPNGTVVEGKIEFWHDYDETDQVQVKIDGKTYFAHSTNCVLIKDE